MHFLPPPTSPGGRVAHPPLVLTLRTLLPELFVPMLYVCALARADAFSLLQPPSSLIFQISPHYFIPQRHDLASRCNHFTKSVGFRNSVLHILSALLFRTGFYSQGMYELNNIHDRELRNEGISSSDVRITSTNNREEEVEVFMLEI